MLRPSSTDPRQRDTAMNLKSTLAIAAALCLGATAAAAQTAPAKPAAKPAAKAAAKKAAPAAAAALPAADAEQLAAAERAHLGEYQCEFSQSIDVSMNPKSNGYVDVKHNKQVWTMKPVVSSTGAVRLEDVKGQTLLLQIANKSMLMDTKAGRRVVDGCIHEKQRESAAAVAAAAK
jgi:membrane-bound inhibitor of C-type lysozyme